MKINLAIDCLEGYAFNTITSIHSFLNTNKWFDGKIYIIVPKHSVITSRIYSEILSIYENFEIVNAQEDLNFSNELVKASSDLTKIQTILSIKSLFIKEERVLFISSGCLIFKDLSKLLGTNEVTLISNPSAEIDFSVFYRNKIANSSLSISQLLNQVFTDRNSILSLFQTNQKITTVLGETSSSFNDRVFLKKKSVLNLLNFIKYDTLRGESRNYSKINYIWIQHQNVVKNILKRPSFRGGISMFSSNSKINPKLDSLVPKQITPVLDESLEIDISMSVIIPARNASLYIEQCLDSIFSQIGDRKIEVLVGVDSCRHTLNTLRSIRAKYSNLKIFYSELSVGAYVMRNSLFEKSNGDALLFFDADDVLLPSAISTLLKKYNPISPIRFKYINFNHGKDLDLTAPVNSDVAHGVFFIPSSLFQKIGGFQNWQVGADTEFMKRYTMNKVREIRINSPLFFRRIHNNSLTQNSLTGYKSKLRSQIKDKIKSMRNWSIPVHRHTTKLIEK